MHAVAEGTNEGLASLSKHNIPTDLLEYTLEFHDSRQQIV